MSDQPFPPADAAAFLGLCAGDWMSLRSSFELSSGGDDDWHSSERGELVVGLGLRLKSPTTRKSDFVVSSLTCEVELAARLYVSRASTR